MSGQNLKIKYLICQIPIKINSTKTAIFIMTKHEQKKQKKKANKAVN